MINPAVETDLVGELVECFTHWDAGWEKSIRGRCRAVTSDQHGTLRLWVEVIDDEALKVGRDYYGDQAVTMGDILLFSVGVNNAGESRIRLVRGAK